MVGPGVMRSFKHAHNGQTNSLCKGENAHNIQDEYICALVCRQQHLTGPTITSAQSTTAHQHKNARPQKRRGENTTRRTTRRTGGVRRDNDRTGIGRECWCDNKKGGAGSKCEDGGGEGECWWHWCENNKGGAGHKCGNKDNRAGREWCENNRGDGGELMRQQQGQGGARECNILCECSIATP